MYFDPAIAAREAFGTVLAARELGNDTEAAEQAEELFSSSAGPEATEAYRILRLLGLKYPDAMAFQAFLVFITWQQVTEHTIPPYFREGLSLSDTYLNRFSPPDGLFLPEITELRLSFRAGLNLEDDEPDEYAKDTVKGGD